MRMLKTIWLVLILGLCLGVAPVASRADDYTTAVFTKVANKVVYPHMAKLRGQEGKVTCAVSVAADGSLSSVTVEASSGIPDLDNAAMQAVKDAAPFDSPSGGATTVHGRVVFQLDAGADDQ